MVAEEVLIAIHISGDDPQQEIALTEHHVALGHLRKGTDLILELSNGLAAIGGQFHLRINHHVQAEFFAIEHGDPAIYITALLQLSDPTPAGRLGQIDALGDLRDREARIMLQQIENMSVGRVQ